MIPKRTRVAGALLVPTLVMVLGVLAWWDAAASAQGSLANLPLRPGWNLISFPSQPQNPAINAVIPAGHPISLIIAHDAERQGWVASERDASTGSTGLLKGDLTQISSVTVYLVFTTSFQPLPFPPRSSSPSTGVSVSSGWNLLPVLSNANPLPNGIPADIYFAPLNGNWVRALIWDASAQVWLSISPGATVATLDDQSADFADRCGTLHTAPGAGTKTVQAPVCIGEGLWLWATQAGALVP